MSMQSGLARPLARADEPASGECHQRVHARLPTRYAHALIEGRRWPLPSLASAARAAGRRRAFRLSGEDKGAAGPNAWAAADDQTLRRIAQTGIEQIALFIATARPPSGPATAEAPAAPPRRSSTFAWLDDWTPEASGIF